MPNINHEEYEILKRLSGEWKWVARDRDRLLFVFNVKPLKGIIYAVWYRTSWDDDDDCLEIEDSDLFQFIRWEDDEPYNIAELIKEYEVEKLRCSYFEPRFPKVNGFYNANLATWVGLNESEETEVKNIEELKSWFEDDKLYLGGYVKNKIDQLDEPEATLKKEPKYNVSFRVKSSFGTVGVFLYKQGDEVLAGDNFKAYYPKEDEFRLTEQEIRSFQNGDVLFEHFAVKVEEEE